MAWRAIKQLNPGEKPAPTMTDLPAFSAALLSSNNSWMSETESETETTWAPCETASSAIFACPPGGRANTTVSTSGSRPGAITSTSTSNS